MAEVGSAFVSILPSAKGFGRKLDSQVGGEVGKAGKSSGKKFGGAFKVGALAVAGGAALAGNFLKGAVEQASDLNEQTTKIEAIFGKGSAAVQKFAEGGAKALGQTKLDVLEASANFGVFGKAAGLGGKDLAKFSTDFTALSTDLASFNNTSPEEAVEAIGSALRGEAEPMRRFGVLLDDATLRNEALKLGLIETTKDALTPQQKVLAAQAAIYKQTGDAQGDFQKTSGGLANQQRILSAQWSDMKTTVGTGLLPVVTRFVTFLNNTAVPAIGKLASGFKTFVLPTLKQVAGVFTSFSSGGGASSFTAALGQVSTFITSQVVPRFREIVTAVQAFVAVALPIVQQFVAGMRARIEPMLPMIRQVFTQVASIITGVMGLVKAVIQRVTAIVGGIWSRWGSQIMDVAAKAFGNIVQIVSGALRIIQGIIKTVTSIIKGDWSGAWAGIKMIVSGAWTAIKGIVKQALLALKTIVQLGWAALKAAAKAGIDKLVSDVRALPGQLKAALGNVGSLLYSAGRDLIQGMINGVRDMAGSIASAAADVVGNAISAAKAKLGIRSPSKVFKQIGKWTMQGLEGGFKDGGKRVIARVESIVAAAVRKAADLKRVAQDFSRTVAGTFSSDIFGNGAAGLKLQLQADTNDANKMLRALRLAEKKGLSGGLFKSLAASGDLTTAQQLASMSKREIEQYERMYAARNKATSQLGGFAEREMYGKAIREQNQLVRQLTNKLDRLEGAVERGARRGVGDRGQTTQQRRRAGR